MSRPAGTNHHHACRWSAKPFCAKYSMVPSVVELAAPSPRNDSPASLRMAAMTSALLCMLSAGDHVVMGRAAFGSCRWIMNNVLNRFGITHTAIDGRDNDAWERAIQPNTKVFFFETPANPTMDIVDMEHVAKLA